MYGVREEFGENLSYVDKLWEISLNEFDYIDCVIVVFDFIVV